MNTSDPLDLDAVHPDPTPTSTDLDLDLVRACVEDRLAPAPRDAFAVRLATDPALAELVNAYAVVHGFEADDVPPMRTRFEDLRLDAEGVPAPSPRALLWLVRGALAAAAAVLLVLGVGFLTSVGGERPPRAVLLAAIPADAAATSVPDLPAALESYGPAGKEGLRFLDGYAEARAAAMLVGRPLLLFAQVPSCPLCRELERDQFKDEALATAVEPFVLGRENMMKPSAELQARLDGVTDSGWPFFVVDGADGRPATLFGLDPSKPMPDGAALARLVASAYATVPSAGRGHPLPWDATRKAAADLRAADAAADDRACAEALARVAAVAPEGSGLFEAVRVRRAAQAARARAALDAARTASEREGVAAAGTLLSAAVARFEGTEFQGDFQRVAAHVSRYGSFPVLEVLK